MDAVEIRLKGPGVTTLGLVDGMGNVLMARRVLVLPKHKEGPKCGGADDLSPD
jgi:hypothetical protein